MSERVHVAPMVAVVLWAGQLTACVGGSATMTPTEVPPTPTSMDLVIVSDQGFVCVYDSDVDFHDHETRVEVQNYEVDKSVQLEILIFTHAGWYLASGPDCYTNRVGSIIEIHSTSVFHETDWGYGGAPPISAHCKTEPLEMGSYVLVHGSASYQLEIPSTSLDYDVYDEYDDLQTSYWCFKPTEP